MVPDIVHSFQKSMSKTAVKTTLWLLMVFGFFHVSWVEVLLMYRAGDWCQNWSQGFASNAILSRRMVRVVNCI
jgi:hypothetical protein